MACVSELERLQEREMEMLRIREIFVNRKALGKENKSRFLSELGVIQNELREREEFYDFLKELHADTSKEMEKE